MKVVIQGASGLKNSGDEAILQSILQKADKSYDITVITFDVEYSTRLHPNVKFVKMGGRECLQAVKECDLFILGGGGLLQDETSIYNVTRWMKYLKYCIKKGKKTYLYANSIGPVRFKINKMFIKKWLNQVDRITLRDELSLRILKSIIKDVKNAEVTADPVFSLKKDSSVDISRFHLPPNYAVVCVRHWYDTSTFIPVSICNRLHIQNKRNKEKYRKYVENIAHLADYISEKYHLSIVMIPFLYGRDNCVMEDINSFMRTRGIILEDKYLKPEEVMEIISNSEMLTGMRLHSIIYGAISAIPALIIDYSAKVRGMAGYLGLEEYTLKVDTLEENSMQDTIDKIMKNRDEIQEQLRTVTGIMKQKDERNQKILEELIEFLKSENNWKAEEV